MRLADFCGGAGFDSSVAAGVASVAAAAVSPCDCAGAASAQVAGVLDAVSSADAAGVAAAVASDEVPSLLAQAPVGVGAGTNDDGVDELTSSAALSPSVASVAAPLTCAVVEAAGAPPAAGNAARGTPLTPMAPPRPPRPPRIPPRPPRAPSIFKNNEHERKLSCQTDERGLEPREDAPKPPRPRPAKPPRCDADTAGTAGAAAALSTFLSFLVLTAPHCCARPVGVHVGQVNLPRQAAENKRSHERVRVRAPHARWAAREGGLTFRHPYDGDLYIAVGVVDGVENVLVGPVGEELLGGSKLGLVL